MLTNLAYYKLLKSLPEDTLSGVNNQLILLAAAGALNSPEPADNQHLSTSQLLASADFLKQQGLLDCLRSQFSSTQDFLSHPSLLSSASPSIEVKTQYSPTKDRSSAKESADLERLQRAVAESPPCPDDTLISNDNNHSPSRQTSPSQNTEIRVKDEPRSPNSIHATRSPNSTSPKPSFRPVNKSPPSSSSSTVHWGVGSTAGPPPNKTCTTTTTSHKFHPCDASSILSLLAPYKPTINVESRLQKYCLKQGADGCTPTNSLTNIGWTSPQKTASGPSGHAPKRSYNCYWMSPVGPCNRQYPNKDDLYKHLKTHVNDLEALTPATAVLQPLNPGCSSCDKARSGFSKVHGGGRYQPYSKCTKCTRCVCRR